MTKPVKPRRKAAPPPANDEAMDTLLAPSPSRQRKLTVNIPADRLDAMKIAAVVHGTTVGKILTEGFELWRERHEVAASRESGP